MARRISMQYIADRLGVSKYTVSQALNGKPGVSEATRLEVTALAEALGYDLRASVSRGRQPQFESGQRFLPETQPMPALQSMPEMQATAKTQSIADTGSMSEPQPTPGAAALAATCYPPGAA